MVVLWVVVAVLAWGVLPLPFAVVVGRAFRARAGGDGDLRSREDVAA